MSAGGSGDERMTTQLATSDVRQVLDRALDGERIGDDDAVTLLRSRDLVAVGRVAGELRNRKVDPTGSPSSSTGTSTTRTSASPTATSARSTAAPATRVRATCCRSRSSSRRSRRRSRSAAPGSSMQGGHHPDLGIEFYEDLFRSIKSRYRDPLALPLPARGAAHLAPLQADRVGDALAPPRCRARLAAGRWRGGARRSRARHHRAEEDELGRLARRDASRAPARACRRRRR